ncbi:MAG: hypothetical protein F6K42_05170 [Leptolyngbya sp. SIO1D8]|nr:hypothetical protein [Leptolyngbya sp. SIO1D8]
MDITASSLLSRTVRENVLRGGKRTLSTGLSFTETDDGQGGIIGFLSDIFGGSISWLTANALKLVRWGLSKINFAGVFQWLVNTAGRIAIFDWNKTDQEIAQLMRQNNLSIIARWGALVGNGLGWLSGAAIGYGISLTLPVIGGATLARTIAATVGREALEELSALTLNATTDTIATGLSNTFLGGYLNLRKYLKSRPIGELKTLFGDETGEWIRYHWGNDGEPDISFANQLEESIESIESDGWRTFIENATEEFIDGFIESGFVVAMELDAAYQQQRMQDLQSGATTPRELLITPDRDAPHETFYLGGQERAVKEKAIDLITNHRVLGYRDIGQIVGQPAEDWYRAKPQLRVATVVFKSVPGKGWTTADGSRAKVATYTIPDLETRLTWSEIKTYIKPFTWGRYRATCNLDNGRQMAVYGASGAEAERVIRDFLRLTTAEILTLSITEEKDRDIRNRKDPTPMYPYRLSLLVRRPQALGEGLTDLSGNRFDEAKTNIPLWVEEEPEEFSRLRLI